MKNLRIPLFLLFLAMLSVASCSNRPERLVAREAVEEPEETDDGQPIGLVQDLQDVRYSQSKGDRLQWKLEARTATQAADGPIDLQSVEITYYGDEGRVTVVRADSGIYDGDDENAALNGNVTVTTSDGGRFETSAVNWNREKQRISGDGDVKISRGGSIIQGKGFELLPEAETFRIYQVGGIIHRGDTDL